MAKRLYMTSADYLAIAISPALIMALVGSLVFFLVEVLYVGQYQARLNYAFALFVFAAVLIARISIEMGSERAALFALPLGIVMFLFLLRFVEHPNAFSPLINLALLALVWWCAHQLTWDSTVIDDDEDASGEGLMQRIGVDGLEGAQGKTPDSTAAGAKNNELLAEPEATNVQNRSWWQRLALKKSGPHTPGLWVLYFSLAALPLFGIGQHWIPVSEVGRRRYVFVLLLVYVAAALALLVTTSFLSLRRYLRQRHVEMPLPIAGTWVGVGAALIVVVMLLAAVIPRPGAEIALSRVPWQAGSRDALRASQTRVNRDGGEEEAPDNAAGIERTETESQNQDLQQSGSETGSTNESAEASDGSSAQQAGGESNPSDGETGDNENSQKMGDGSDAETSGADKSSQDASDSAQANEQSTPGGDSVREDQSQNLEIPQHDQTSDDPAKQEESSQSPSTPHSAQAMEAIQNISSSLGGLAGALKIIFYAIVALLLGFVLWKYRQQILQTLADILRELRALFRGRAADGVVNEKTATSPQPRPSSFRDFHDPFTTGQHTRLAPEDLVRYTFAAFEAWANDRGRTRTPDCTPHELVGLAVDPELPMYKKAKHLVRLYGEVAYASRRIPRESVNELREFWQMMGTTHSRELSARR
jgi:hypothetical protein